MVQALRCPPRLQYFAPDAPRLPKIDRLRSGFPAVLRLICVVVNSFAIGAAPAIAVGTVMPPLLHRRWAAPGRLALIAADMADRPAIGIHPDAPAGRHTLNARRAPGHRERQHGLLLTPRNVLKQDRCLAGFLRLMTAIAAGQPAILFIAIWRPALSGCGRSPDLPQMFTDRC